MKKLKICCIGAGYVGGPTMAVIAYKCPDIDVTVVDIDKKRIDSWNDSNFKNLPIYENGLSEIIEKVRNKNLFFSTDIDQAISESKIIFMAVNTPTKTYGEGKGMAADLTYVEKCARNIAKVANNDKIIVEKSTLPVRTAEAIKTILNKNNTKGVNFQVLSNPEFLAEGTAINDLFKSDRVLIGGDQTKLGLKAIDELVKIYKRWISIDKIITTNIWSSELSKLVSNAFLAQRISSINSISALCEKTEAEIEEVSLAVGADSRIGNKFLNSSVGFGGSCFQKDILNLVYLAKYYGLEEVAEYWHQVLKINDYQKKRFSKKIIEGLFKSVNGKKICFLGWAFKKDTNDTRESAAIYVAEDLLNEGAEILIYDPKVNITQVKFDLTYLLRSKKVDELKINEVLKKVTLTNSPPINLKSFHAIAILTEWDIFKTLSWEKYYKNMYKPSFIFDGRGILDKNIVKKIGFSYYRIGSY